MNSPEEHIVIKIPRATRNIILAKIVATAIAGCTFGYLWQQDNIANLQKAKQITLEQYEANFEQYKSELIEDSPVGATAIIMMLLGISIMVGAYEMLSFFVRLIIGEILK